LSESSPCGGRALARGGVRSAHEEDLEVDTMPYVITEPCVDVHDRACMEECPVDCIYDGLRKGYIQPDECVECGACVPVCPVQAIYEVGDVPDEWRPYVDVDREFFGPSVSGLGSPGGAVQFGELRIDHPYVSALEPLGDTPEPLAG
jgi:ferredoxin